MILISLKRYSHNMKCYERFCSFLIRAAPTSKSYQMNRIVFGFPQISLLSNLFKLTEMKLAKLTREWVLG